MSPIIPIVLGLPILGAIWIMLIPREEEGLHRGFGIAFSLATFAVSLALLFGFKDEAPANAVAPGYQFVVDKMWIPAMGAHFKVGIDGISLWLVLLTTFLTPIILLSAQRAITTKVREFVVSILVLETAMLGAFVALDLFLFYIFWELMLVPMYLLIGIWGGNRRMYASIKFVIYTMVGSLLMLVAIFYVYAQYGALTGTYTTDLIALQQLVLPRNAQVWCFAVFALAFAIKVPLFPLHTWLPDAHVEAPTAGSVILAGVLLKFGVYGFLRFAMPLFPYGAATLAPYIAGLSVIGIIYGALVAFAQDDVKKLVAYSSVSHLAFCSLGIFALTYQGIEGSIYAMVSHGLTTSGLFLAIGVLYERRHTRRMAEYGGVWARMPVFGAMFLIVVLGSAGLPGLSGFIGEFLTLFGTFIAYPTFPEGWNAYIWHPRLMTALAASGVILGAVYLLYMFQKVMLGPLDHEKNGKLKDLSGRELWVFLPLVAMIFVMGLFPRPFLRKMEPSVKSFVAFYHDKLNRVDGPPVLLRDAKMAHPDAKRRDVTRTPPQPAGAKPNTGARPQIRQVPMPGRGRPARGMPPGVRGAQPPRGMPPGARGAQPPRGMPPGARGAQPPRGRQPINRRVVRPPTAGPRGGQR